MPTHLAGERELLTAARKGDAEAFMRVANQYGQNIYRLALSITGKPEEAEDVLQETFLQAYSGLHQSQDNSSFYTWLARIALDEALRKVRQREQDRWLSFDELAENDLEEPLPRQVTEWDENLADRYAPQQLAEILQREIMQLEPACRIVFVIRDIEGLSTEETAKMLRLSVPIAKSLLLRGRLQLRERLNKYFQAPFSHYPKTNPKDARAPSL